jgi:bisanhydrobacterioruberin hydratase
MKQLNIKNISAKTILYVKLFFVLFYTIGYFGITNPSTSNLFLATIPFVLLMSVGVLLFFHEDTYNFKTILLFSTIYILGYAIEVLGVNTGLIFGNYQYGSGLGLKLFNTPLMIGVNWLFLIYASASLFEQYSIPTPLKVVAASLVMIFYDLVLELVAPQINMWSFDGGRVPFLNYFAWFLISIFFHTLLKLGKIKTHNQLALTLLISQTLFFIALILFMA